MKKLSVLLFLVLVTLFVTPLLMAENEAEEDDPPEVAIGERLFLETRFSQAFHAHPGKADPVMATTRTTRGSLRGPFAGKTMNCRACHMVDEHKDNPHGGMRSYADYARRPPVPARKDGALTSPRNSMSMVNISIKRRVGELFHYDGEFNSMEDLVRATLTGRNYGWLPAERDKAIAHIARIVRSDDGKGALAKEFGGSYRKILKGTAKDIPAAFRLSASYRIDVDRASDKQIFDAVSRLIAAYVRNLTFSQDKAGQYNGSPYDRFVAINKLPRKPRKGETLAAYNLRLLNALNALKQPRFVKKTDGTFKSHKQAFVFGPRELQGMKLFFTRGSIKTSGGNCASCHAAPHFSDFRFHNTGLVQNNYDQLHGDGAFMKLAIPALSHRNRHYDRYLPATFRHPSASSRFRSVMAKQKPGYTDLGLWNVFANPDMPAPQAKLKKILCDQARELGKKDCRNATLLPLSIAAFKTPVLRDLGHSNPYMHSGQFDTIEQVLAFYLQSSQHARAGILRNAAPQMSDIRIKAKDISPLAAFIRSLNEDYE